jgi:hypothetical protein
MDHTLALSNRPYDPEQMLDLLHGYVDERDRWRTRLAPRRRPH